MAQSEKLKTFKIFPKLGTRSSDVRVRMDHPGGYELPLQLISPPVDLTPESKEESYHRYLEKYGIQQMFSNIIQDLYLEPVLPELSQGPEYFTKKWLNFLPIKPHLDKVNLEIAELKERLGSAATQKAGYKSRMERRRDFDYNSDASEEEDEAEAEELDVDGEGAGDSLVVGMVGIEEEKVDLEGGQEEEEDNDDGEEKKTDPTAKPTATSLTNTKFKAASAVTLKSKKAQSQKSQSQKSQSQRSAR